MSSSSAPPPQSSPAAAAAAAASSAPPHAPLLPAPFFSADERIRVGCLMAVATLDDFALRRVSVLDERGVLLEEIVSERDEASVPFRVATKDLKRLIFPTPFTANQMTAGKRVRSFRQLLEEDSSSSSSSADESPLLSSTEFGSCFVAADQSGTVAGRTLAVDYTRPGASASRRIKKIMPLTAQLRVDGKLHTIPTCFAVHRVTEEAYRVSLKLQASAIAAGASAPPAAAAAASPAAARSSPQAAASAVAVQSFSLAATASAGPPPLESAFTAAAASSSASVAAATASPAPNTALSPQAIFEWTSRLQADLAASQRECADLRTQLAASQSAAAVSSDRVAVKLEKLDEAMQATVVADSRKRKAESAAAASDKHAKLTAAELSEQRRINAALTEEKDALEESQLQCSVCLTAPPSLLYTPCAHVTCCAECHEQLPKPRSCPKCRAPIKKAQHVFL